MPDLAALLVEAGAVSAEVLQRAVERQREHGGTLDTALLELQALPEPDLVGLLSRASGLPPPPAELIEPDARARRVFPARVAERHGLAPFRLDGRELSLLAMHPVDLSALDEISFMLSLHLVPHVAPEWRVRDLMARTYGLAFPERLAVVARAVRSACSSAAEPAPTSEPATAVAQQVTPAQCLAADAPPPVRGVARPGGEPDELVISLDENFSFQPVPPPAEPAPLEPRPPEEPPGPGLQAAPAAVAVHAAGAGREEAQGAGCDAEGAPPAASAAVPEGDSGREEAQGAGCDAEDVPPAASAGAPAHDPGRDETEEPLAAALAQALSATDPEALLHESAGPPPSREAPPHWTREEAFAALEDAQGRDAVVAAALRYARDFFEAAALFAVTKERVSGQDAVGWDDARARCRSLRVAPDEIGLFRAVIETSGPYLGPIAQEPGNDVMLAALGRPRPRIALVYPVSVRGRTVCLLYADNGDAPVSPRRLGDLLLLAAALGGAFERILRHAKRIRAVAPPLGGQHPSPDEAETGEQEEGAGPERPSSSQESFAYLPPQGAEGLADADAVSEGSERFVERGDALAGVGPALEAPPVDESRWELRESGCAAAPSQPAADEVSEPFHVTAAVDALEPPAPFDAAEVVHRLCGTRRGSADRGRLLAQLAQRGPDAAAALRAAFPGPLDAPPSQVESEPVEERGPVLAALFALGIVATPYLVDLLREPDPERRRLASLLLGRVRDPAAFLPLADRVFDPDVDVQRAALGALARMRRDRDFRPVLERLRRALLEGSPERAAPAARALARLGDVEAIPLLIEALNGDEHVGGAGADSLEFLTCRRFGREARRWLTWWKEHRGQPRADWLFAALADDDREVRIAAAERLREGGSPPLPWLADAPPLERSEAARAWRVWWDERGQAV